MSNPRTEIDGALVEAARTGDRGHLRDLVNAAYPLVRRWALVRTGDPADADDLTQDVMIQMIRRLDSYQGSARFSTWLYTVTRNAAADRYRKAGRRAAIMDDPRAVEAVTPDGSSPPDAGLDAEAVSGVVGTFFRELPERQRAVFDLVELQGLSAAETAESLGIAPVSVRAHLFKARRALRMRILEQHPELVEEYS